MRADELSGLSASDIADHVKSRSVSPTEIVKATLVLIEERNPKLNAITHVASDEALARAADLEALIARGEDPGPFAGVPTVVKDLFGFYPGWPATIGGIPGMAANRASTKSYFPTRMEAAGSIVMGMSNSPIFGYRGTCDNPLYGPTRNPFDLTRNSGGSSGGSAAAVAGGILPLAGANDGGGSIRIPASWCGLFGFQASAGRIPQPMRPIAFDTISPYIFDGVVSRTVADSARALSALTAFDPSDPFSLDDKIDWLAELDRPLTGLTIGYDAGLGGFPVERSVRETIEQAVKVFETLGARIDPIRITLPCEPHELSALWRRLVATRMARAYHTLRLSDHRDWMPEAIVEDVERAGAMTASDIERDLITRTQLFDAFEGVFRGVDLLISPTTACLPVLNATNGETEGPSEIAGCHVDPLIGWCLTYPTNLTGNPSASVPAGLSQGLPVGMQIIGPRLGDRLVMRASAAFERAMPWRDAHREVTDRILLS